MTDAVLSIDEVSRTWKRSPEPVLDRVSLSLDAGDIVWVGGANGAGKTTLLRIVCGLLSPQSGEVRIKGRSVDEGRADYYRDLGFLSAGDRGLNARLTPRRHLEYWAKLALLDRLTTKRALDDTVETLGLAPLLDRRVDRLSLGQRQRVRIAMACLHSPALLVLDEPRNSLDDDGYEALRSVVGQCVQAGGAVLWCSPRGEDRVLEFDRGYVLERGHLRQTS